jgi:hypothetical protein
MNFKDMNKEDILRALGLETKPAFPVFGTIAIASAALLIGAGIGMILAPKPGRELRNDLNERWSGVKSRVRTQVGEQMGQGPVTSTTPY